MPKRIVIPARDDLWDEANNEFITVKEQTLVIEHSLVSISKWEQKWKRSFLNNGPQNIDEFIDYIKCMTINNVNELVYSLLTSENIKEIDEYIGDPMTATTFSDNRQNGGNISREIITNELIYYSMIQYGIPHEFEKWHLNRLLALIRVFSIKQEGSRKMSRSEAAAYQRALNEQRLAKRRR